MSEITGGWLEGETESPVLDEHTLGLPELYTQQYLERLVAGLPYEQDDTIRSVTINWSDKDTDTIATVTARMPLALYRPSPACEPKIVEPVPELFMLLSNRGTNSFVAWHKRILPHPASALLLNEVIDQTLPEVHHNPRVAWIFEACRELKQGIALEDHNFIPFVVEHLLATSPVQYEEIRRHAAHYGNGGRLEVVRKAGDNNLSRDAVQFSSAASNMVSLKLEFPTGEKYVYTREKDHETLKITDSATKEIVNQQTISDRKRNLLNCLLKATLESGPIEA